MTTLGGVDAGGSHTEAVVSDRSITTLTRHTGPAAALRPDNIETAASLIVDTLHHALAASGRERTTAVAVGVAGAGRVEERSALTAALKSSFHPNMRLAVVTDGEIALEDAFPGTAPGIVVLAGTGSVAFARDTQGETCRSGGLGPQLGDEGSGYALGRGALAAVGSAADNRGPATALSAVIHPITGTTTLDELVRWAHMADRETVASLAETVCTSADDGDAVARDLVNEAGEELARLVEVLAHRFTGSEIPVAFAGSVLTTGSPVRNALLRQLGAIVPSAVVSGHHVDPARGALKIAATL